MKIEAILFDSSGTLMAAQPSYYRLWIKTFEKYGITIDEAGLGQAFAKARKSDHQRYPEQENTGRPTPTWFRDFNREGIKATEIPLNAESVLVTLEDVLNSPSNWKVFPDVIPALSILKETGYKMGVISNWDWRLPELLDNMNLGDFFEVKISSSSAGFPKPRREVFLHALDKIGSAPENTVYIGDTYDSDILGALNAGLKAIFLDRAKRTSHDTLTIATFDELETAIASLRS